MVGARWNHLVGGSSSKFSVAGFGQKSKTDITVFHIFFFFFFFPANLFIYSKEYHYFEKALFRYDTFNLSNVYDAEITFDYQIYWVHYSMILLKCDMNFKT